MSLNNCKKQINDLFEKVYVVEPPEGEDDVEIEVEPEKQNIQYSPNTESGSDTVYGQGTPPNPEDETYLNQLKGSTKVVKVKINTDKKNMY